MKTRILTGSTAVQGPRTRRGRRGSALLFATLMLLVLTVVGMTLAAGALQSLRISRIQQNTSIAFNVAESGAERGVFWLRQQPSPPAQTTAFDPFGGPIPLGSGTYQVTIDPDDLNPTVQAKRYLIRSVGISANRQETLELFIQLGNFGRYAYFTDYETSSVASGPIFFKAGDVIDGPAHSNNTSNSDFHVNWTGSSNAIFRDTVTSVAPAIDFDPRTPYNESEWERVFDSGSRGFRVGVNRVELPENTDVQKVAAWGRSFGFPTSNGVHIPAGGPDHGIYIRGDSTMNFSVTSQGWQKIVIVQGYTTYTVTIKPSLNQHTIQVGSGAVTTYAGVTNGVIYSTGHITSLKGELADSYMSGNSLLQRNAFTIATDVINNKSVTVTDNLTYDTDPSRSQAWDSPTNLRSAAMGIVARNIIVGSSAPRNLSIDAVLLAGGRTTSDGSFYVSNWNSKSPTGTLNLLGGVIQKKRGPVGTFNSSTGTTNTGYDKNYVYDQRMAVNPPPYFPTTGTYERLSFRTTSSGFYP
ncbi:MAG: pilus assembly PilX family protein [Actinomycetota bacterium]